VVLPQQINAFFQVGTAIADHRLRHAIPLTQGLKLLIDDGPSGWPDEFL
jgi:hypothetical protein